MSKCQRVTRAVNLAVLLWRRKNVQIVVQVSDIVLIINISMNM